MVGVMLIFFLLFVEKVLRFFDLENYWFLLYFLILLNMFFFNVLLIDYRFLNILRFVIFYILNGCVVIKMCCGSARVDIIDYNSFFKVALKFVFYNKFVFRLEWVWIFFFLCFKKLRMFILFIIVCFLEGLLLY